jgi:hypothetical protein
MQTSKPKHYWSLQEETKCKLEKQKENDIELQINKTI